MALSASHKRIFVRTGERFARLGAAFGALGFAFDGVGIAAQPDFLFAAQHRARGIGEFQSAVGFDVGFQQAGRHQLAIDAAPLRLRQFLADAEGAELLVAELFDLCGFLAEQHVDQVSDAEALSGAVHAGQRHLRGLGRVPGVHGRYAVVAFAAVARMFFAEIAQQGLVAAGGGFAEAEQRVEFLPLDALAFLGCVAGHIIWRIDTTSPRP